MNLYVPLLPGPGRVRERLQLHNLQGRRGVLQTLEPRAEQVLQRAQGR